MDGLDYGNTYTYNLGSYDDILGYIDKVSGLDSGQAMLLSRTPHNQLFTHLDIDKVETYWVTNQNVKGAILPNLDQIENLITDKISKNNGLIVVEGMELLYSKHEFSQLLKFSMRIKDHLHRKPWCVIFVFSDLIFDDIQKSNWYRESPAWSIPSNVSVDLEDYDINIQQDLPNPEEILGDENDLHKSLSMLTRIPREGYTNDIAKKRILQWRRMGLDVSAAEPALFQSDEDASFAIYKRVENLVRKAIELDNLLDVLEGRGLGSEAMKMRFRIRQLTGLADVEKQLNDII